MGLASGVAAEVPENKFLKMQRYEIFIAKMT